MDRKPTTYPEALLTMLVVLVPGLVVSLVPGFLWGKWAALVGMAVWMLAVVALVAKPLPRDGADL